MPLNRYVPAVTPGRPAPLEGKGAVGQAPAPGGSARRGLHASIRGRAALPALIATAGLIFGACSSSAAPASSPPTPTAAPLATSAPAAASSAPASSAPSAAADAASAAPSPSLPIVPLVVYSAQGYDSAETKAFQAATGIPVQLVDDSTGPLLVKVQAEINNPKWGLLWVDGDEAFASMDQQNYLVKGFEPNVAFNSLGTSLIPSDKSYIPTGVTMAGTVVYDTKTVKNPPTSWNDLLSAQWKGAVGMNDPAVSGPTYPFVAGLFNYLGGVTQGETFLQKLKANGLHTFQTNGDTLHALEGGQIKIALIQSSAGIGAGLKTPGIKTAFIGPSTPIPSVIGIDAKASPSEIAEAEQFAAYVLSSAGQKVMQSGDPTGDSLYWPVLDGVNPLSALPPLSSVPAKAIDAYTWGGRESAINTWFTNNIVH